jgi:hypothetical protein
MRLALIALASIVIAGCCSRQLVARDQVDIDIFDGPPCVVVVTVDGVEVMRAEHAKACNHD